jgi:predicted RNA-binding protein with TRAM domain
VNPVNDEAPLEALDDYLDDIEEVGAEGDGDSKMLGE